MSDKFYDDLISGKINKSNTLDNLYTIVKKNIGPNKTHFYSVSKPSIIQFADLLFLPEDDGYKYALVVVDIYDRKTDARPLKTKTATEIIEAFKSIWSGKYLKNPVRLIVDAGSEFKGDVDKYFKDNKINIKRSQPGRHSQTGIVEQKNLVISRSIFKRQNAQELLTGASSTEWVQDLPHIIAAINRRAKPVLEKNSSNGPVCKGEACELLNIGDLVRVALDEPRAVDESNKKLHGRFRASDIRWEITPRKIENIYLNPGMPPLYKIEGKERVTYTKNQLQSVNSKEKLPNPSEYIRNPTFFKVEKILDKKVEKGKTLYLIKWFGFSDENNSWESENNLKEDVPKLILEYNKSQKPKKLLVSNSKPVLKPSKKVTTPIKNSSKKTKVGRAIKVPSKFKD